MVLICLLAGLMLAASVDDEQVGGLPPNGFLQELPLFGGEGKLYDAA
jgi:hypothetical protein